MAWKNVKQQLSSNVLALLSSSRRKSPDGVSTASDPKTVVSRYYAAGHAPKISQLEVNLSSLFESLRDPDNDEQDKLELDSTMNYLQNTLKIKLDDAGLFVAQMLVQAPTIGEITRQGFIDGWKQAGVGASHQEHAAHVRSLTKRLSTDQELFKKVYRYTFVVGRERDQRALSLENALVYWGALFTKPGMCWVSDNIDWFDLWKTYLSDNYKRSVNKDMWNMTLNFALKTLEDESLSFWSADGAWPSVIDSFVEWCREKGIGKEEHMEVDNN